MRNSLLKRGTMASQKTVNRRGDGSPKVRPSAAGMSCTSCNGAGYHRKLNLPCQTCKGTGFLKYVHARSLPGAYSSAFLSKLLKATKRQFPQSVAVSHILPRAYCVAKPSLHCGVFVAPPQDREKQVKDCSSILIQSASVAHVNVGDWASLAYVVRGGVSSMEVIRDV
jgi:hypothetical protein